MSTLRRVLAVLATALLVTSLVGLVGHAPAQALGKKAENYGQQAFRHSNTARDNNDRAKLRKHACLQKYANRQARKMARQEKIWHQDLGKILSDCNMNYVGENVAAGFQSGKSVIWDGWMKSDGHRENILRPQFKLMAVAGRKGDDGRWYAAQVFGRKG